MPEIPALLVHQIESGLIEEAARTVELLTCSIISDPKTCSRGILETLQKARTLAVIHRSHIQRRLRSLQASRLFDTPGDNCAPTWRIDG